MKAKRQAKQNQNANTQTNNQNEQAEETTTSGTSSSSFNPSAPASEPQTVTIEQDKLFDLMERLARLEGQSQVGATTQIGGGLQLNAQGRAIGVIEKYSVNPEDYPDPRADIISWFADQPTLKRFGFADNYILTWEVSGSEYETKNGTWFREPKFQLTLYAKMYNDDGTEKGEVARLNRLVIFEDEASVRKIATDLDMYNENVGDDDVFHAVRLERIKQWLTNIFTPPKIDEIKDKSREMVLDGQVVTVVDVQQIDGKNVKFMAREEIL